MAGTTIVTTDRSGAEGIDFGADGETWIIRPGVYVWGSAIGVSSIYNNNTLKNNGHILGNDIGIDFTGDSLVVNNAAGVIQGHDQGVYLDTGAAQLINHGLIASADTGVYFSTATHGVSLNNNGTILGEFIAVSQQSISSGGAIHNSGVIRSGLAGGTGIYVHTAPGLITAITNTASGIIRATLAIYADNGDFLLTNFGKVIGGVVSDTVSLADLVLNHGRIAGAVHLGGGADAFSGIGGTSGGVFGEAGNDRLIGGSRADGLHGGDDFDKLTGMAGADRFFFDTTVAASSIDTIADFSPAQGDKIVLSEAQFGDLGPHGSLLPSQFRPHPTAVTANQHILYNPANGFLSYDQDGNGGTYAPIHFATLTTHPLLHSTDFLVIA